jgi:phosphoribosyl 1,2-cyclic phosphodiesterase
MANSGTSAMSVRFRGVRGSTPAPGAATARYGGNTSCVEVRAGNEILILDAGTGIRDLGIDLCAEHGSDPIKATLLISHTHWDHIQGLPFFAPAFARRNQLRLMAAPGAGARVDRGLRNQADAIHSPVSLAQMLAIRPVEELAAEGAAIGPFFVKAAALNHPGGCAGFRIEAGGASIAYLPDHEPFASISAGSTTSASESKTEALAEFIRGVDLLILDTQYTPAEYPARLGWGHGCLPDSVSLAARAGAHQLALFHHDPSHSDEAIDAMLNGARALADGSRLDICAAAEHASILLGSAQGRVAKRAAA